MEVHGCNYSTEEGGLGRGLRICNVIKLRLLGSSRVFCCTPASRIYAGGTAPAARSVPALQFRMGSGAVLAAVTTGTVDKF